MQMDVIHPHLTGHWGTPLSLWVEKLKSCLTLLPPPLPQAPICMNLMTFSSAE